MKRKTSLLILGSVLLLSVACSTTQTSAPTKTAALPTEQAYTVDIRPADFVDVVDNAYFPLIPGARYVYEGMTDEGLERVEIEVLAETRVVMGVTATVVRDTVYLDGEMVEDTLDWFAQDKDGNVWYLGEDSQEYENGAVVSTAGSWEAGVDGALPGIIMYADPAAHVGDTYRQEYYKGEAEDMAQVVSVGEAVSTASGDYENCLKTKEWTPLEPGFSEFKYYAPAIGPVLEVVAEGGKGQMELVEVTAK